MGSYYANPGLGQAASALYTGAPFGPEDVGLLAWNFDIMNCESQLTFNSGRLEAQRIRIGRTATCTGAVVAVGVAGSSLTVGQNLVALCDTTGDRLALSEDQTTAFGSTGIKQAAWTAPITVTPGDYYVFVLSVGSTAVSLRRADNTYSTNVLKTTPIASLRGIRGTGTGSTSIPDPVDIAANMQATGTPVWVGLY